MVSLSIASNVVHSSRLIRIKRNAILAYLNFWFMQPMKVSSGWFTQTTVFDYNILLPAIYISVQTALLYMAYKTYFGKKNLGLKETNSTNVSYLNTTLDCNDLSTGYPAHLYAELSAGCGHDFGDNEKSRKQENI